MEREDSIKRLNDFRSAIIQYHNSEDERPEIRRYINNNSRSARRELIETGCLKLFTISPPPIIGGLIMRNVDPFTCIFDAPYGGSMIPQLVDMIDEAIGVLNDPTFNSASPTVAEVTIPDPIQKGFVFIAMPMAGNNGQYDDVHDAIKDACSNCGLRAERVDDVQSNDRITDRLLESIRKAEFVVVDLTDSKPNVFYEAGYAYGIGKTPIYVARENTKLEFDLKDYPIIFFASMRQLKEGLEKRLRALAAERKA